MEKKLHFCSHKKVSHFFINMDKPVVFISCQYMQSWVFFIKLTIGNRCMDLSFHASSAIDTVVVEAAVVVI